MDGDEVDIIVKFENISIEKEKNVVKGWVVSQGSKNIKIRLSDEGEVHREKRDDVVSKYNLSNVNDNGFTIIFPRKRNLKVTFFSDNEEKTISLSRLSLCCKKFIILLSKIRNKYKRLGFVKIVKFFACKLCGKPFYESSVSYKQWLKEHQISKLEYKRQCEHNFQYEPLISVIVPLYDTPERFLKEMIESVINQTYKNWELCLVEGSNTKHVKDIVGGYTNTEPRIKFSCLKNNLGISGNTNAALKLANGEFIGLLDHDDLLSANALYEVVAALNNDKSLDFIYSDEDKVDERTKSFNEPNFKPDFAIDTLRSYNYITHFSVFRKSMIDNLGEFDTACDGAQDYDMILRVVDYTDRIHHISKVLYHWRTHSNSTSSNVGVKSYVTDAGKLALEKHLKRRKIKGAVRDGLFLTSYKQEYEIINNPKISIIIPNKNHTNDLKRCLKSIKNSTYSNFEIIIVENNSDEDSIFQYYEELEKEMVATIVNFKGEFNFSAINNFGRRYCKGDHILLLNNDVEVINTSWLEELLMHSQRSDIGCVGAKLYYPDNTVQHGGVIVGIGGVAGHAHKCFGREEYGFMGRLKIVQNLSAVTAACVMIKSKLYDEVSGLNEEFQVAFNDVDFCLRIQELGYLNVFTPYAELYHYESLSRGLENTCEKVNRFNKEIELFSRTWGLFKYDPYYNVNLTLEKEDFSFKEKK